MKKLAATLLLLCLACVPARAAYVRLTLVLTNIPATGDTFVRSGTTVRWTNNPLNSTTWIQTNGIAGSATNLLRHLGANMPSWSTSQTNGTNIVMAGSDITFSLTGTWGYITTNSTPTTTNLIEVVYPFHNLPFATNRTNQADALVTGIDTNASVAFRTNATALANHVNIGPGAQTFGNKTITNSTIAGGTLATNVLTNTIRANINLAVVTNLTALGGSISNSVLTNITALSGNLTGLTNGLLTNTILLNVRGYRVDFPGSGAHSQQVGSNATASGVKSVALGVDANAAGSWSTAIGFGATNNDAGDIAIGQLAWARNGDAIALGHEAYANNGSSMALGPFAIATNDTSVAIGYSARTEAANQIVLGTAVETILVPGAAHFRKSLFVTNIWATNIHVFAGFISNTITAGTNRIDGAISFSKTNITIANGNNNITPGSKRTIVLNGNTAAANLNGIVGGYDGRDLRIMKTNAFTLTIMNNSGFAAATTDQILTGTGADVTFTNSPVILDFTYESDLQRWVLEIDR